MGQALDGTTQTAIIPKRCTDPLLSKERVARQRWRGRPLGSNRNHDWVLLRDSRCIAHERRTAYVARLVDRERPATVHRRPVVPHDKITDGPLVRIDELALG